jgi:SNF2 family DNA or RNA helicase
MTKLQILLKATMLRRTKKSTIDGKPLLELPPKTERVVHAKLSEDELSFYNQLENSSRVAVSKYLRQGTIGKNYTNVLVLLLRLRQACCHPHLHLEVDELGASGADMDEMMNLARNMDASVVDRIKELDAFECPICYDAVLDPTIFFPCGHDSCAQCLAQLLDNATQANIQAGSEGGKARCPVCRMDVDGKKLISYTAFRKVYMPHTIEASDDQPAEEYDSYSESEDDESWDIETDDEVDTHGNLRDFIVNDESEAEDDDDKHEAVDGKLQNETTSRKIEMPQKGKSKAQKSKGKAKQGKVRASDLKVLRKDANKSKDAFRRYMHFLKTNWIASAKTDACMKLLAEIQETGEKTIIFSQWTLLLDLLEVAMKKHDTLNIKHCRYDGGMSAKQRNDSAHRFRDNADIKVMLVSLRAGNAGLNLTTASRVIIMDPFWNPYTEDQAVDRTHRIGQQRPVTVHRILVEGTVEDRIVELQNNKRELVENALNEGDSRRLGRLSNREISYLFGISA